VKRMGEIRGREKKTVNAVPGRVRPRAALDQGEDPMEVPEARGRHRGARRPARDERGEAGGRAPQRRAVKSRDAGGDQGPEQAGQGDECDPPRDLLSHPGGRWSSSKTSSGSNM